MEKTYIDYMVIVIFIALLTIGCIWLYNKYEYHNFVEEYACESWQPVSKDEWVNGFNCIAIDCYEFTKTDKINSGLRDYIKVDVEECICESSGTPFLRYCERKRLIQRYIGGYIANPNIIGEIEQLAENRSLPISAEYKIIGEDKVL